MLMRSLARILEPLANIYVIFLCWLLSIINLKLFMIPLDNYAKEAGLLKTPDVLDVLNYYSPEEGYQALALLGEQGRHAYRLANYTDFVLPVLLFLSVGLPFIALKKSPSHLILAFLYLITDYLENLAEKYVLEIFPERNDTIMMIACYTGLTKIITIYGSLLVLLIDRLYWLMNFIYRVATSRKDKFQ